MKKILFPTDFSETSLNAFVYAVHLAKRLGAEIITLHVYDLPQGTVNEYYNTLLENYDITEWGNFENYKSEVPKLRAIAEKHHANHVKISHLLERGIVVDTILEVCERDEIDYVIMGTKGADGIIEAAVGTITEKVMNEADQMVFAIPSDCHFIPISKILFLTQFEDAHKKALGKVLTFAAMFNAHVDVLCVTQRQTREDEENLSQWRDIFRSDAVDFHILENDSTEETIMKFINLNHVSLVALTVKHKGLLERLFFFSIASKMAFHSKVPVLSIKR